MKDLTALKMGKENEHQLVPQTAAPHADVEEISGEQLPHATPVPVVG